MKNVSEENNKPSMTILIIVAILLSVLMFILLPIYKDMNGITRNKCGWSEHNIFTNETGGFRIFNNCYVPISTWITKTEKCGFLGISCYETKPYREYYQGTICFNIKTGEKC